VDEDAFAVGTDDDDEATYRGERDCTGAGVSVDDGDVDEDEEVADEQDVDKDKVEDADEDEDEDEVVGEGEAAFGASASTASRAAMCASWRVTGSGRYTGLTKVCLLSGCSSQVQMLSVRTASRASSRSLGALKRNVPKRHANTCEAKRHDTWRCE
jgi:hypothetical protein